MRAAERRDVGYPNQPRSIRGFRPPAGTNPGRWQRALVQNGHTGGQMRGKENHRSWPALLRTSFRQFEVKCSMFLTPLVSGVKHLCDEQSRSRAMCIRPFGGRVLCDSYTALRVNPRTLCVHKSVVQYRISATRKGAVLYISWVDFCRESHSNDRHCLKGQAST